MGQFLIGIDIHRFKRVESALEDYRFKADFDIDSYIAQGGFGYIHSEQQVTLEAWISQELYTRLKETPLNENKTLIVPNNHGWGFVTATLNDEMSTLWWLQSLGAAIRVVGPAHWRKALQDQAKELSLWYSQP